MTEKLTWWLAESATLTVIDKLVEARNKSITEDLNQPGSATFRIPIKNPLADAIEAVSTCVVVTRAGQIVWSGPVWSIRDEADETAGWTTVGCKGWQALLDKRLVNPDQKATLTGEAYTHIHNLLALANAKGVVPAGAPSSTMITAGLANGNGVPITKTYEPFTSIGGSIVDMTKIENGVDIAVDPSTRKLDVYTIRGQYRDDLVWMLKGAKPSLSGASRTIDADSFGNRQWVIGSNNVIGFADDYESQSTYGLFEQQTSLTNVPNQEILGAYANAEILVKGRPIVLHEVTPSASASDLTPVAYSNFVTGDSGRISVSRGRYSLSQQQVRIFGFMLSDGDDGVEKITSLKLEAQ